MRTAFVFCAAGLATAANAQLTFIGTNANNFYRATGGNVESFVIDPEIVGMDIRPNGEVWASAPSDANPSFYQILNATSGTPMAQLLGAADDGYTSLTFITDDDLFGFTDGGQIISKIDTGAFTGTEVGPVGVNDHTWGGSAYDPANDIFYALGRELATDEVFLFTVDDYDTNPSATLVGSTGIFGDGMGLDFYEGQLYAGIQNLANMHFEAGSINAATGEFTLLETLATDFSPDGDVTSLIVVPAPAGAALLGLAGLAAVRRRR